MADRPRTLGYCRESRSKRAATLRQLALGGAIGLMLVVGGSLYVDHVIRATYGGTRSRLAPSTLPTTAGAVLR
jgi:hypothetical protein